MKQKLSSTFLPRVYPRIHGSSVEEAMSDARLRRAFAEINTEIERTPYPKQPWHKLDGLLRSPHANLPH